MVKTCGICGGSGAGKTTLTRHLLDRLGADQVSVLAFDSYYRDQSHLTPPERAMVNYDHPDSLDHALFAADLELLRSGQTIEAPVYDFATHTRTAARVRVEPRPIVIVEGILLLSFPAVQSHLDLSAFIDVPEDVRLARRIKRDVAERGRDAEDVVRQFRATVAPMHDQFVEPFRSLADRIVAIDEQYGSVADEIITRLRTDRRVAS